MAVRSDPPDRRALAVRSGRLVAMRDRDLELLPEEEARRVYLHFLRPGGERRGDVDAQAVLLDGAVAREVLAFEVGVDRHLEGAASAQGRYEVQRDDATALAGQLDGLFRKRDSHRPSRAQTIPSGGAGVGDAAHAGGVRRVRSAPDGWKERRVR